MLPSVNQEYYAEVNCYGPKFAGPPVIQRHSEREQGALLRDFFTQDIHLMEKPM